MFWRDGARKDLQRGDLNALVELKRGWGAPSPARLERLGERGFIEELDDHKLRVTMKGRVALLLGRRQPGSRPERATLPGRTRLRDCKNDFAL